MAQFRLLVYNLPTFKRTLYMAVQAAKIQMFPSDHLEQFSRSVSALTLEPYKNVLYYFFPFIGAFFSGYYELIQDPSQEAMMPLETTKQILGEVEDLTRRAGLNGAIATHVTLNHEFSACGGRFSLTTPALFIPYQHLFRGYPKSPFSKEKADEDLKNNLWVFSDDETRFLIARELSQIKADNDLLRIAVKVAVLFFFVSIYAAPISFAFGLSLYGLTLASYFYAERSFQGAADLKAVSILQGKIQNPKEVAILTLEKMLQQNLLKRAASSFARCYITESGNNLLDFARPFLTRRIETLTRS